MPNDKDKSRKHPATTVKTPEPPQDMDPSKPPVKNKKQGSGHSDSKK